MKHNMKQCITPQQVDELSDKGKERLRNYWNKIRGHYKDGAGRYTDLPWLDIGRMIELIYRNTNDWGIQYFDTTCNWGVRFGYGLPGDKYSFSEEELCDALWKTCKQILEDK